MALLGCWYADSRMAPIGVTLWLHNSTQIGETLLVVAPLTGAVAAWAAGRDHRRGLGDLLAATPRPFAGRVLASWGGTTIWGVLAYCVVGVFVAVITLQADGWGSPPAAPIIIGLLAIVTASAAGFAAGTLVPSRLTPPLFPIVAFLAMAAGANPGMSLSGLSPWTILNDQLVQNPNDVFYAPKSFHLLPMTLWLIGLTGIALAVVVIVRHADIRSWVVLAVSAIVALSGAMALISSYDTQSMFGPPWEDGELMEYTPACADGLIRVCVHPAFEAKLDDIVRRVDLLVEPLMGIPGAPVRAEQLPYASGMYADGTLTIDPLAREFEMEALALVQGPVEPGPGWNMDTQVRPEQDVIARWLARRVDAAAFDHFWDRQTWHDDGTVSRQPIQDEIDAAVERFNALHPAEQRAWLEANYADLRSDRLSLDNLP
jgi:hypothetical protein